VDGYVTIGTSLDSKGLEKDLRDAERQLRQYEKEAEKLTKQKVKIEADVSDFEAAKTLIQQQTDETLKNAQTQEQVNFVLEQEADNLKVINAAYDVSKGELDEINRKIRENATNQENVKAEIDGINANLIKVKKTMI
jgi:carbonic anhydrase